VFLAYASPKGHTFIDRELYLPASWTRDPARCREAGVPEDVTFATKPELARRMLVRLWEGGVQVSWVTADEVYGSDPTLRSALECHPQAYVMAVRRNEHITKRGGQVIGSVAVIELMTVQPPSHWERLSAGDGTKGPRLYDWTLIPLDETAPTGWSHWLLLRRSLADPTEIAYYRVFALADTPLSEMVRVAGTRWAIEVSLESAKGEVGLDQYQVRRWQSWYRHITLVFLAHAFLVVTRLVATPDPPGKKGAWRPPTTHAPVVRRR
jgi:SRSO17 transposase